jgi:spore coat protein CotH
MLLRMKIHHLVWSLFGLFSCGLVSAQTSTALWDDQRVGLIYLTIPTDSLDSIYANVTSDHYYQAEMVYDDGVVRDSVPLVGLRLRGNTSRYSAKKSFKVSFNEYVPGRRYQGAKKLNLNGQHNDPTMIREKLFYDTWNRCGMAPRRTTFVCVFINQVYYGLYTCLEELDKEWLSHVFAEDSGNLYKCTYPADLVYIDGNAQSYQNIPSSTASGGRAYDLQTNTQLDDYSDLVALITQLDRNPDAQFATDIFQYLDVHTVLKALAIDVATGNWDDYFYNKNNYYLYHRLGTGQLVFFTYDTDNTFGVDWVNRDWATRDCSDWLSHSESRPLAEKLLAVPAFRAYYYDFLSGLGVRRA